MKTINTPSKMKAIAILFVLFGLTINTLYAIEPLTPKNIRSFAPAIPNIAFFEDPAPETIPANTLMTLAPAVPSEADFNDSPADSILLTLAPVVPAEAEFEETN